MFPFAKRPLNLLSDKQMILLQRGYFTYQALGDTPVSCFNDDPGALI
jgi:hypothetical protein